MREYMGSPAPDPAKQEAARIKARADREAGYSLKVNPWLSSAPQYRAWRKGWKERDAELAREKP